MTSPQSVRDRLRNLARARRLDLQLVLTTYGIERTLHRLGLTARAHDFILKGAQLLRQRMPEETYRASRDGDLLARGDDDVQRLRATIEEAATLDVPDGLTFDLNTLTVVEIREATRYAGVRAKVTATLAGAQIPIQLDIAFGDATVPPPTALRFRTLLDQPAPNLKGYAVETVIAKKLETITSLGLVNSRLKDYFDLWFIANHLGVDEPRLAEALQATFERRGTRLDPRPPGLTTEFSGARSRQRQWTNFLRTAGIQAPDLDATCAAILTAYGPALSDAQERETES